MSDDFFRGVNERSSFHNVEVNISQNSDEGYADVVTGIDADSVVIATPKRRANQAPFFAQVVCEHIPSDLPNGVRVHVKLHAAVPSATTITVSVWQRGK